MWKASIFCAAFILLSAHAYADSVHAKDGNIFYVKDGKINQITSSGRDKEPVLDHHSQWVYFIRGNPGKWKGEKYYPIKGETHKDGMLCDELWRINVFGADARMLFQNKYSNAIDGPDPDYTCASIHNIQLSPDGDKVYFETPDWVTSAALHIINPDGSGEKQLGPGSNTKIVMSARTFEGREKDYAGYIVTSQHRYFFYGGSYDWFYLFTPDMKREVAPLGDDFSYFTEVGGIKYTDHSERTLRRSDKLIKLTK